MDAERWIDSNYEIVTFTDYFFSSKTQISIYKNSEDFWDFFQPFDAFIFS